MLTSLIASLRRNQNEYASGCRPYFENGRVEWISCFPSNNLIEVVAQEGIRPIMFRQERGAIMAADGYSRMNNRKKFGVIVTQGGPGSENCMGGGAGVR